MQTISVETSFVEMKVNMAYQTHWEEFSKAVLAYNVQQCLGNEDTLKM